MPKKIDLAHAFAAGGDYPVSLIASTLGVERSTLFDRVTGCTRTRGPYTKAGDADLLPRIRQIAAQRPTYGDRRIAAVLNRQQRTAGLAPVNHKRVYRIMAADRLLPARRYTERPEYGHDGVTVAIRSNLRWCSDGSEFTCWSGAFIIDAHAERSSHNARSPMRASADPTCATSCWKPRKPALVVWARPGRSRCCRITARLIPPTKHGPFPGDSGLSPTSRLSTARSPTASWRPSSIPSNAVTSASCRCRVDPPHWHPLPDGSRATMTTIHI